MNGDTAFMVNVPQIHVPSLGAELALVSVAAGDVDVSRDGRDFKTWTQEPFISGNISCSRINTDSALM